ncbi:NAD(P)-binding protein [Eremomyces bilateralis CBS 781.70]|uniref:NAD(P)-binding protein n=1 Tax=Eremomyces bilateralis CBS 781.70 TaxID=1392243 RepID=A0A6G1GFS5_9PEZI|nr:NAD(P)-binding protein [Eremomyces bilateralis CBS 781.70]KAF1816928.1 NAD(P)-binding protein [Eremomyces bilateralis CBS 781.70]
MATITEPLPPAHTIATVRSSRLAPGVALVTGGARGLGNAIAVSFAKEGARGVALVDIQDEATFAIGKAAVEAFGTKCIAIRADVTKEADVERAVDQVVKEFGRLDYAANFAGVIGPATDITETPLEKFAQCMSVNSTGVFLCTKHELRVMKGQNPSPDTMQQRGSIVNCASVNSLMSMQGVAAYTASKHAVNGITKTAALEARAHSIRVNAVSPGFLLTPMITARMADPSAGLDEKSDDRLWERLEARQGRRADFVEIGDAVVMLSTPRMSLINGVNLMADGGFTINEGFQ